MKSLHYVYTLFRSCIASVLMTILGASCANDNTHDAHFPAATTTYNKDTEKTRPARMRKALREPSKGQEMHQKSVENVLKQQQHLLDERGLGEIITEEGQPIIESNIRNWEEKEIKRFASHNCRLRIDPFVAYCRSPLAFIDRTIQNKESLFQEGKISAEALAIAREEAHLKKENYRLTRSLSDFLISANNFG